MIRLAAIGKTDISTEAFARHFFSLLNVPFEERESSHYEEGGYFKGVHENVVFKVYTSYNDEKAEMPVPMPLTISIDGKDNSAVDSAIDFIVRSKLIAEGYKFLQELDSNWIAFS